MNGLVLGFCSFIRCAIVCSFREASIDLFVDRIKEKNTKTSFLIARFCVVVIYRNGPSNLVRSVSNNNTGKNGPSYLAYVLNIVTTFIGP